MRKLVFFMLAAMLLTSCEKSLVNDDEVEENPSVSTTDGKRFTFTVKGDFSEEWKSVTRGYLQADGKDMTDLWVLDYMGDVLVQQVHQSDNTAEDFGKPVMQLVYGAHHVYFVASRGTMPKMNVGAHFITWEKVSDTFYKDYEVDVVATSNGNRSVTLERVVTKLRLTFTDAIPENAATINITPATWYKGLDYVTGDPCAVAENQTATINIPSTSIGQTGVQASMFSVDAGWYTADSVDGWAPESAGDVQIEAGEMFQIGSDCGATITVPSALPAAE
jgi:hypothetical protein